MKSMKAIGGLLVLVLASGCGPRLKKDAESPAAATAAPTTDAPEAKMSVQYDSAKLDGAHKYSQDGEFKVSGLFFKDGEPQDATVKVSLKKEGEQISRVYDIELAGLAGASAKVPMWDDGFLTVIVPNTEGSQLGLGTSNQNVKAASLEQPGQAPSTCYFGKEVLDGQIRFALCELQTQTPRIAFVDAIPEGPAPDQAAPAAEAAPAPEAPKAN